MLPPRTLIWGACMFLCYGPPRHTYDMHNGKPRVTLWYGPHNAGFGYIGG